MEDTAANKLPEVDSLPDGFVNSSTEGQVPPTPVLEQEKLLATYKDDDFSEIDQSRKSIHDLGGNVFLSSEVEAEKTPKLRTFPVLLSEKDTTNDVSTELVQMPNEGHIEQTDGSLAIPCSAISVSEASVGVSECSEAKEHVQGKCQTLETFSEGGSDLHSTVLRDTSSESIDKNRKQESSETKRKTVKRTFKSEKEFLEFTLKYQQVIAERDSAIAVRDKLESLCRELQRQNKMLMDECKQASMEGRDLRLNISSKFQDAIKDVSNKLEEQKGEYLSQIKENEMLRNTLKQFADQCALSEQQYAQNLKQKTLELQIADLKVKQHEERLVQEQSQMKLYAEQVSQLLATEKNLRLQLTADGEKFQQFQDALMKSNEVFGTFKQETEKMAKSLKELKKENVFLRSKCDKSDVTLIELVEEREYLKKQLEKTKNQKDKLDSLCRSLQAERKQHLVASNSS